MDKNDKIKNLTERNVVEVIEKDDFVKRLNSGEKLRIKLGIDPTGSKLHLGRAVSLRKLKEFQDLGHVIVLIIGDFTAMVGDASDKKTIRPQLNKQEIKDNMKDYKSQIGKILDTKKVEFRYNSEWLGELKFETVLKLASLFTVHQLIDRRNFKERFQSGKVIGFHEFMYPLMQGYDSVAIKADVEIGGTDQLFNLLAGRKLQEYHKQKPQNIMTLEMLGGLDGDKMSTTQGNVVNITDNPDDMFGKLMSMNDELIPDYYKLCTDITPEKISDMEKEIKNKETNPMELKKDLACEIVKLYYDGDIAQKAREGFVNVFQKKETPKGVRELVVRKNDELKDVLVREKIVTSGSVYRKYIKNNAIDFNGEVVSDVRYKINKSGVVKVGKKIFLKLILK